VLTFSSF